MISIKVNTSSGEKIVEIDPKRNIKHLIFEAFKKLGYENVHFKEYTVWFKGNKLDYYKAIENCGIEGGDKVTLQPEPIDI